MAKRLHHHQNETIAQRNGPRGLCPRGPTASLALWLSLNSTLETTSEANLHRSVALALNVAGIGPKRYLHTHCRMNSQGRRIGEIEVRFVAVRDQAHRRESGVRIALVVHRSHRQAELAGGDAQ